MINKESAIDMVKSGVSISALYVDSDTATELIQNHGCVIKRNGDGLFIELSLLDGLRDHISSIKQELLKAINGAGIVSGPFHAAYLMLGSCGSSNLAYGHQAIQKAMIELADDDAIERVGGADECIAYCKKGFSGKVKSATQYKIDESSFGAALSRDCMLPDISSLVESVGGNADVIKAFQKFKTDSSGMSITKYILLTLLSNSSDH